jgi:hypothetical protein
MTATLPSEVREAFSHYITCEYTTIDARQQPIVWPVTPYYDDGAETIDVTTGLGYPKKANDARANPRVSLFFSDPTGSGVDGGRRVLVQGTAEVDDRDLVANRERYWRESGEKLPATKDMHPPKPLRGIFNWYYTRLYVKVRPERVFLWPDGDHAKPPEVIDSHQEEVRSGHVEEPPEPLVPPEGGKRAWDERIGELGDRYENAVLAWIAPDGFPLSARVPVVPEPAMERIALGHGPAAMPLTEGRACLTAHRHAPDFSWQENFQVRGDLVREGDSWALVPHRLVGGFELPENENFPTIMRRNFSKARRFRKIAREELKRRSA